MEKQSFMIKFQNSFERILMPLADKLTNQRHLSAIRDAMALLIPLTIIGGFSILLAQPPVNPETMTGSNIFYQFLLGWYDWAATNAHVLFIPFDLTLGIISVYVVAGVAYRLAPNYNLPKIETAFTALLVFLCIAGAPQAIETGKFINTADLGATGMFTAIIIGLLVTEITNLCVKHNVTIKMPASVPPNITAPFKVLVPMVLNVIGFLLLNMVCVSLSGGGLSTLLTTLLQPLLSATDSLFSILLLILISQTLWFFGIHGDNMVGAVVTPIITMNIALNLEAYNAGKEMTHIFAGQFNGVWGVWTPMIALLVVMNMIGKSQQLRTLGKLAPISTAFNINEPLIFGIPTVLNLYIFVPQIIITTLNIIIAYTCTAVGLIGKTYLVLPWTTPAPLAAFLSTMDWRTIVLWVVLFILDIIIFLPFVKNYDKKLLVLEQQED